MKLAEAAEVGFLVAAMIKEANNLSHLPVVEFLTNNFYLSELLRTSHVIQDTRLRVDVARIREILNLEEIEVKWIRNEVQLADPLTKAVAPSAKLLEDLRQTKL